MTKSWAAILTKWLWGAEFQLPSKQMSVPWSIAPSRSKSSWTESLGPQASWIVFTCNTSLPLGSGRQSSFSSHNPHHIQILPASNWQNPDIKISSIQRIQTPSLRSACKERPSELCSTVLARIIKIVTLEDLVFVEPTGDLGDIDNANSQSVDAILL